MALPEIDGAHERYAHETLKAFSLTSNYNKWVCGTFAPYLSGRKVLEIGCGIGNLTGHLRTACRELIGVDVSDFYLRHLRIDFPDMKFFNYDVSDPAIAAIENEGIEVVVAVNVLEHVKNDLQALKNAYSLLKPGGRLILFVPALSWLYGTMDESLSHYRRYDRGELEGKVTAAGFKVERSSFSNLFGIAGWFMNGRVFRRKTFPILQTIVFDGLVPFLARAESLLRLPVGMNLTVIAVKDGSRLAGGPDE